MRVEAEAAARSPLIRRRRLGLASKPGAPRVPSGSTVINLLGEEFLAFDALSCAVTVATAVRCTMLHSISYQTRFLVGGMPAQRRFLAVD